MIQCYLIKFQCLKLPNLQHIYRFMDFKIYSVCYIIYLSVKLVLRDCNRIRTHNHLVYSSAFEYFAQVVKWLSCVVRTYFRGIQIIFFSFHILEQIVALKLPWSQGKKCNIWHFKQFHDKNMIKTKSYVTEDFIEFFFYFWNFRLC